MENEPLPAEASSTLREEADAERVATYRDEASFLWTQRQDALEAPNYSPQQFADLDEQLEAQLDGLAEAGDAGWAAGQDALPNDGPEDFFVAGVLALRKRPQAWPALVERASPDVLPGLASALGWVDADAALQAVAPVSEREEPAMCRLALEAHGAHRRDPGGRFAQALQSGRPGERARALRLFGELGLVARLPDALASLGDDKLEPRFWAASSAVLLGDRQQGLEVLKSLALRAGTRQMDAFRLALLCLPEAEAHRLLVETEALPAPQRLRVIGSGYAGQVRYVPWLIEQMAQPALARIAAEAFVHITGADFNREALEALPPEGFEDGPSDDPEEEDVELPADIALPWPDLARVQAWWGEHQAKLPTGRLFLGRPVEEAHCVQVLKSGQQRQRVIAALHLALLRPGRPLFPTGAPAWRQQRLLARAG